MNEQVVIQPQTNEQRPKRRIEYIPPSDEKIERFAYSVCRQLGQKHNADYCDTDTLLGFTSFLKTVVSIKIKALNKETNHGKKETSA